MPADAKTTLYLRGVPRAVVREAKAKAARAGLTLAQWVTERISDERLRTDPRSEPDRDLTRDFAFYEEQRIELERKYAGEYIAIIDRAVVDHDPSFEKLAARVFHKHAGRPVCMPLVGRNVVRVRSPRRALG